MENKTGKSSPLDVFMYLLATGTLYFSVYSVLNILFSFIDRFFPDQLLSYYSPGSGARWPLALLVVIFPVHIWVNRFIFKDALSNPEKANIKVRRWFLYLTIFLAAVLLMGDFVGLVYKFLEGDLTVPFILKIVSIFVVGAAIFWYYLYDLRRKPKEFSDKAKVFSWAASFFVLVVIVAGFFVAGSPFKQRLIRFDDQKTGDLQNIQWQIVSYWQQKGAMPESLNSLRDDISGYVPPVDSQGGESYEYRAMGDLSFELCANFNLGSDDSSGSKENYAHPRAVGPYGEINENWSHGEGRHCFSRTIDPEIYRTNENVPVKPLPL